MSADGTIRAGVSDLPAPELDPVATPVPKPLDECRIALVTTAGLKPSGGITLWAMGDQSFQVLPDDARDVQLSHASPNFDRTGIIQDLNVVYPIDRLHELADGGVVGSVNERHVSFMGAQSDFATIIQDTGPRAAQLLVDDGVDVVLLTPI